MTLTRLPEFSQLGIGNDYFSTLFSPRNENRNNSSTLIHNKQTNGDRFRRSQLGNLGIAAICSHGTYLLLHNSSFNKDINVQGYTVRQYYNGVCLASYELPRLTVRAGHYLKMLSDSFTDNSMYQPPFQIICHGTNWVCDQSHKCSAVLCTPSGQAVAWASQVPMINISNTSSTRASPVIINQCSEKLYQDLLKSTHRKYHSNRQNSPMHQSANESSIRSSANSLSDRYCGAGGMRLGSAPMRKFVPNHTYLASF